MRRGASAGESAGWPSLRGVLLRKTTTRCLKVPAEGRTSQSHKAETYSGWDGRPGLDGRQGWDGRPGWDGMQGSVEVEFNVKYSICTE